MPWKNLVSSDWENAFLSFLSYFYLVGCNVALRNIATQLQYFAWRTPQSALDFDYGFSHSPRAEAKTYSKELTTENDSSISLENSDFVAYLNGLLSNSDSVNDHCFDVTERRNLEAIAVVIDVASNKHLEEDMSHGTSTATDAHQIITFEFQKIIRDELAPESSAKIV